MPLFYQEQVLAGFLRLTDHVNHFLLISDIFYFAIAQTVQKDSWFDLWRQTFIFPSIFFLFLQKSNKYMNCAIIALTDWYVSSYFKIRWAFYW